MAGPRLCWLSFAVDNLSLGLGVLLLLLVELDAIEELLATARVLHVLHTDVDALRQDALLDTLVDDDTESVLCHVVHHTGAAVIALVRHALLHRTITPDVDDVSLLVRLHVGGQRDDAIRPELA